MYGDDGMSLIESGVRLAAMNREDAWAVTMQGNVMVREDVQMSARERERGRARPEPKISRPRYSRHRQHLFIDINTTPMKEP